MASLGAFVLTYHRPAALCASLEGLLGQTRPPDEVLVVDNGCSAETEALVRKFGSPRLRYEATGANLGSAGGSQYGVRRLAERGHDYVYCGDDDNPPHTADTIERLLRLIESLGPKVGGVGALGARWDWRRGELVRLKDEELTRPLPVDFVGGNHSLILRRETVATVGPPDGRLFFGYPDLEHCLRLRQGGYELWIDGELMRILRERTNRLDYSPGRSVVPRRPEHAMWRNYYTTRNYVHMMNFTFARPDLARRETAKAMLRAAASWTRGPRYGWEFTRLQLRGILDGYRGRQGQTIVPRSKPAFGENDAC